MTMEWFQKQIEGYAEAEELGVGELAGKIVVEPEEGGEGGEAGEDP